MTREDWLCPICGKQMQLTVSGLFVTCYNCYKAKLYPIKLFQARLTSAEPKKTSLKT
jgi:hypothetical protein